MTFNQDLDVPGSQFTPTPKNLSIHADKATACIDKHCMNPFSHSHTFSRTFSHTISWIVRRYITLTAYYYIIIIYHCIIKFFVHAQEKQLPKIEKCISSIAQGFLFYKYRTKSKKSIPQSNNERVTFVFTTLVNDEYKKCIHNRYIY